MRTRIVVPVLVLVVAAACSSGDHGGASGDHDAGAPTTVTLPEGTEVSEADVAFARGMIPHHAQAVEMADMALDSSSDPAVLALAERIAAAQEPEIAMMEEWLEEWGQPVPDPGEAMEHGMDGMDGMDGMMSDADMAALDEAGGAEFDRLFLELMIVHHEGALEMAERQLDHGVHGPARDLAAAIISSQQAEIDEMEALLADR